MPLHYSTYCGDEAELEVQDTRGGHFHSTLLGACTCLQPNTGHKWYRRPTLALHINHVLSAGVIDGTCLTAVSGQRKLHTRCA